ncbi:MAG: glycosyltransferase [Muribaculaceae bacterium]|nr:glycosyltransferase [Muribaculaceae bacterium]
MKKHRKIIVSLTSFPAAIDFATGAIKSLLNGKVIPDKIVLYVTLSQFENGRLPNQLLELERNNSVFEIRDYPLDIRSYRKLIPALHDFPDDVIITVDDDVYYHPRMIQKLLEAHAEQPEAILAHRAKKIALGKPYKKWKKYRWYHFLTKKWRHGQLNIPTGCAGVLYPPNSLRKDMLDPNLFRELAPTTDDIWFWAAATANDTEILPVPFGYNKPKSLGKPKSLSLKTINFKGGIDRNSAALNNILNHFNDLMLKLNLGK